MIHHLRKVFSKFTSECFCFVNSAIFFILTKILIEVEYIGLVFKSR